MWIQADTNLKYPSLDTSYLTHTLGAKINAVNLAKKLKSVGAMIFTNRLRCDGFARGFLMFCTYIFRVGSEKARFFYLLRLSYTPAQASCPT
jgi:hypothetical protein